MTTKELSQHKMTLPELNVWNVFCDEVKLNCIKMGIDDTNIIESNLKECSYYQYSRGYHNDIGFYEILFRDRGELYQSIQTHSRSDCMWHYLLAIASKAAKDIEMYNRQENKVSWKYSIDYDGRLFKFFYTIQFLSKIYTNSKYLEDYIRHCTNLLNLKLEYDHWKYDRESQEFVEL